MNYLFTLVEHSKSFDALEDTERTHRRSNLRHSYIIDDAKSLAERNGVDNVDTLVEVGDPADRILKCIDSEKIDCVIMGSRGLNDLKGLFLGSVSHKVANRAPCTCITVK